MAITNDWSWCDFVGWKLRGFTIRIDLWACKILMSMDCEAYMTKTSQNNQIIEDVLSWDPNINNEPLTSIAHKCW